ncbi:hypothetical protein C8N40_101654 [Pontibacter mucosus]|uniref:Uncharacterized protein n=1 Tax=Pontibacter mucosus TaxID=1649266 RepID=A0A2T5YU53_9BACT|nr:hypothetical protein C8N40_101654 [Pontibacter mucosus]
MVRFILFFVVVTCLSCRGQQSEAVVKESEKAGKEKDTHFEKITFSIMQGFNREGFDKDVEILKDGTFYYRLRERYCCPIKANYMGKLDSLQMNKVYAILDATDFNTLKSVQPDEEHASYVSILFTMYNGEIRMKGALSARVWKRILDLLTLVEEQELVPNSNHQFSTAKDVILPPPNFTPSQALLDSL